MVLVDMDMPKTCMTCKIQGSCTQHLGWSNHKKSIRKSDKCPIKCELPDVYGIKTGRWIEDESEMKVWCSECNEESEECSKYCTNCGARMIDPQESEV